MPHILERETCGFAHRLDTMSTPLRFFRLDQAIADIEFNKTIAGCYRDGNEEYDAVGVLLLTWKDDDLMCKVKEVSDGSGMAT